MTPDSGQEKDQSIQQFTVADTVNLEGVGLHTGRKSRLAIHPAPAGNGIVFHRTDRRGRDARIEALWFNALDLPYCTGIGAATGVKVRTTEHLLAALHALGIDNAEIDIDGEEVPIFDGSGLPIAQRIETVGVVSQGLSRRYIRITAPIRVAQGKASLTLEPGAGFHVTLTAPLPGFAPMEWTGPANEADIRREILPARTFTRLERTWPVLLARYFGPSVGRGAAPGRMLFLYKGRVLNRGGLRWQDEFARHRVLDAIGDLRLAGAPVLGRLTARSTRHSLNVAMVRELFEGARDRWEWTTLPGAAVA